MADPNSLLIVAHDFACCFCGEGKSAPAMISVEFNWASEGGIAQAWFAHPVCFVGAILPEVREFSAEVEEYLRLDESYRTGAYE